MRHMPVLLFVMLLACVFAACAEEAAIEDESSSSNGVINTASFAGTWNASGGRALIFSAETYAYVVNSTPKYVDSFSVSGSTLVLTIAAETTSCSFLLSENTLVLLNHTVDSSIDGTYTRTGASGSEGSGALSASSPSSSVFNSSAVSVGAGGGSTSSASAHVHQWGAWTVKTAAAETVNGEDERVCAGCAYKETRTAYATGTPGLAYMTLTRNGITGYIVLKVSVTEGIVYIPAFCLYNGVYLPVTELAGEIVGGAFASTAITGVTFLEPSSITRISERAFYNCSALTSITIPGSVTTIGYGAFEGCTALTSITIPNSVTTIGNYAFQSCTSLTSVTIPGSVTSIGDSAFYGCTALTSITVDAANPNYASLNGILYNKTMTELIQVPRGITGSVTIPNSVTAIGSYAFQECDLPSITIPGSVTTIGDRAFYNCSGLTSVTVLAETPPALGASVFGNAPVSRQFFVPADSVAAYKAAAGWSAYASRIVAIL